MTTVQASLSGNPRPPEPLSEDRKPIKRAYAITLCCAHSVQSMVEEVARNLVGLGFKVTVVSGSEARNALLGRKRDRNEPTIHVVCVQGALKDTVVKPLRQALTTHGGPDEHLFVAVLDLSLPLAMVGQIRRFAEALQRLPGKASEKRADGFGDRRQWREHLDRAQLDEASTRTYRALHVIPEGLAAPGPRTATKTLRGHKATGPRPIVTERRARKLVETRRYRAVTGPVPALERPQVRSRTATKTQRPDKKRREAGPGSRRKRVAVPGVETKTVGQDPVAAPRPRPQFGASIAPAAPKGRGAVWVVAGVVVLLVGAAGAYFTGTLDPLLPQRAKRNTVASAAAVDLSPDQDAEAPTPTPSSAAPADATPPGVGEDGAPPTPAVDPNAAALGPTAGDTDTPDEPGDTDASADPEPVAEADSPEVEESAGTPAEADPVAGEPGGEDGGGEDDDPELIDDGPTPAAPADEAPEPAPADEAPEPIDPPPAEAEAKAKAKADAALEEKAREDEKPASQPDLDLSVALKDAVARRVVIETDKLYVARKTGPATNWVGGVRRCNQLDIDGVVDWRLPYRRELKLLGAVGALSAGSFWSKSTDSYDKSFAYVYERGARALVTWEKSESGGQVVCVHLKDDD